MAFAMKFFSRFETYFAERPVITTMITNALLGGVADTVAQGISAYQFRTKQIKHHEKKLDGDERTAIEFHDMSKQQSPSAGELGFVRRARPFDFERMARFMAWGFLCAPVQLGWYALLKRVFPLTAGATTTPVFKRVACDQFIFTPISLCGFFSFLTFAEGLGVNVLKEKLRDLYVPTLKANYMLWPMVQLINFRMVPTPYQIPFVSTVGIGWTAFLSLTNANQEEEEL
ncbi:hypothetical protein KEM56_002212 [Ascosphaera pollenicola]|nr:hypothetical protein KEM56_002212 [Ascosphaera pollenicola]